MSDVHRKLETLLTPINRVELLTNLVPVSPDNESGSGPCSCCLLIPQVALEQPLQYMLCLFGLDKSWHES